jgi:hypothetical protein
MIIAFALSSHQCLSQWCTVVDIEDDDDAMRE